MNSENISVKITGKNDNGNINAVTPTNIDKTSIYSPQNIEVIDKTYLSRYVRDHNINDGYSRILDKVVYIYPATDGYVYSSDNGKTWNFSEFYTTKGKEDFLTNVDGIFYANRYFYACPYKGTITTYYLRSKDGIIWEKMSAPIYGCLRCVIDYNHYGSDDILIALSLDISKNSIMSYSLDNGETWNELYNFGKVDLDRIAQTRTSTMYVYSQYGGELFFSSQLNSAFNPTTMSFLSIPELKGTCNITHGTVTYNVSSSRKETGERTVILTNGNENSSNKMLYLIKDYKGTVEVDMAVVTPLTNTITQANYSLLTANDKIIIGDANYIPSNNPDERILIFDSINPFADNQSFTQYDYGASLCKGSLEQVQQENAPEGYYWNYKTLFSLKTRLNINDDSLDTIVAYRALYMGIDNLDFNQCSVYSLVDTEENRIEYKKSGLDLVKFNETVIFDSVSSESANTSGNYNYEAVCYIYGENIKRLIICFSDIYPKTISINGIEYKNDSPFFSVDFGYGKYDNVVLKFTELNKPNAKLRIGGIATDVNCLFDYKSGLKNINIDSGSQTVPNYGILSYGGSIQILDDDSIIYNLSELNLFPNIDISILVDGLVRYEFSSNNEINYSESDRSVTISLRDKIEDLQNISTKRNLYFQNMSGMELFENLKTLLGQEIFIDEYIRNRLINIYISKAYIETASWWDILNSFCVGVKGVLKKDVNTLLLGV